MSDAKTFSAKSVRDELLSTDDAKVFDALKRLHDQVAVSDAIVSSVQKLLDGNITVSDDIQNAVSKYLTDNITTNDFIALIYVLLMDEDIEISADIVKDAVKRLHRSFTISDQITTAADYYRTFFDSLAVNDFLTTNALKQMGEAINITGALRKDITTRLSDHIAFIRDECVVGYWDHTEGSGSVLRDRTYPQQNMNIHGAAWEGPLGEAQTIRYDGLSDYSRGPHAQEHVDTPTNEWTMETWIYPTLLTSNRTVIRKGQTDGYIMRVSSGKVQSGFRWDDGSFTTRSAGTLLDSAWNHVVVTYDGAERRHYLNGKRVGAWVESKTLEFTTTQDLLFGANFFTGSERYRGDMSATAISCASVTDEQVALAYNGGLPHIHSDRRAMSVVKPLDEAISATDQFIVRYSLLLDELSTITPALVKSFTKRTDEVSVVSDNHTMRVFKALQRTVQVIDVLIRRYALLLDEEATVVEQYRNHTSIPRSEASNVSDQRTLEASLRLQQSISVFDSFVRVITLLLDEEATIDSSLSLTAILPRNEASSILDSIQRLDATKRLTENPTVSDVFRVLYELLMDEASSVSDSVSKTPTKPLDDGWTTVGDMVSSVSKALAEAFVTSDVFSQVITLLLDESFSVAENRVLSARKALAGILGLADDVSRSTGKQLASTLNIDDVVSKQVTKLLDSGFGITDDNTLTAIKSLTDASLINDVVNKAITKRQNETLSIADMTALVTAFLVSLDEVASVTDTIARFDVAKVVSESLLVLDTAPRMSVVKALAEFLASDDEHALAVVSRLSETANATDLFGRLIELLLSEDITAAELKSMSVVSPKGESVALSDVIAKVIVKPLVDAMSANDDVKKAVFKALAGAVGVDDVRQGFQMVKSLADLVDVLDTFDRTVSYSRAFAEAIKVNDLSPFLPLEGDQEENLLRLYFIMELQSFLDRQYFGQQLTPNPDAEQGIRPGQLY